MLDTQAGREVVYQELQSAARSACRKDLMKTGRMTEMSQCRAELVDSMVSNLGDNRMSAVHNDTYVFAGQ